MKKPTPLKPLLLTIALGMTTFSTTAAWTVNDTFCQAYSEDGRVLLRVKPDTIGMIEMQPRCNGRGEFPMTGSHFGVNDTVYPSSVTCNTQTQYYAVQTTMTTKDIQKIIDTLKTSETVSVKTFGGAFSVDTADFAKTCASVINQSVADFDPQEAQATLMESMGYEKKADGTWFKKSKVLAQTPEDIKADEAMKRYEEDMRKKRVPLPNGGIYDQSQSPLAAVYSEEEVTALNEKRRQDAQSHLPKTPSPLSDAERRRALKAAKHAYLEKTGSDYETQTADWNSESRLPDTQYKGQPARLIQYKVYSPSHGTYDSVIVYVGSDGQVVGTEVTYLGR